MLVKIETKNVNNNTGILLFNLLSNNFVLIINIYLLHAIQVLRY